MVQRGQGTPGSGTAGRVEGCGRGSWRGTLGYCSRPTVRACGSDRAGRVGSRAAGRPSGRGSSSVFSSGQRLRTGPAGLLAQALEAVPALAALLHGLGDDGDAMAGTASSCPLGACVRSGGHWIPLGDGGKTLGESSWSRPLPTPTPRERAESRVTAGPPGRRRSQGARRSGGCTGPSERGRSMTNSRPNSPGTCARHP